MATDLDINLRSLIGAKPFLEFKPGVNRNPGIKFPKPRDRDVSKELINGEDVIVEVAQKRNVELELDPVSDTELVTLTEMQESRQDLCISPPWTEAAVTFLGLEEGLDDMREPLTRGSVDFSRSSARFNSVTGEKTPFNEPHFENGVVGKGLNISDVINDALTPSFEFKTYLTADAADAGGNTTLITIAPADAVLIDDWKAANDDVMVIATEDKTTDTHETFEIDSINTTTGVITASTVTGGAASAVLSGTSDYLIANRTYITNNLIADGQMEADGVGSWPKVSDAVAVKDDADKETGIRSLRVILPSAGNNKGVDQTVGTLQAFTEVAIFFRYKIIFGTWKFAMTAAGGVNITESLSGTDWTDFRASWNVGASGLGVDFKLLGDTTTFGQIKLDRAEVYINKCRGSMEPDAGDTYDAEDAAITSSTGATTTFTANTAVDGTAWDLSLAVVGEIAEADGKHGRINDVNDGTDTITVDSWIGGTPGDGNQCDIKFGVAPGWNEVDVDPANDELFQSETEHGGDYAQGINVNAANEGIQTAAGTFIANTWFLVGAFFKVVSGEAYIREDGVGTIIDSIDSASYTFWSAAYEASGVTEQLQVFSFGGAADFLVDDVMVIKLIGNPFDDAFFDHEPLDTTGFMIFGCWVPDESAAGYGATFQVLLEASRRTYDGNNIYQIFYDPANTRFRFGTKVGGAAQQFANVTGQTVAAGSLVIWAVKKDSVNGLKAWFKIGSAAAGTGVNADTDMATGMTRSWLRGGDSFVFQGRGSLGCILIENTALVDADIVALIDRYSQDKWLNLITKIDGAFYRLRHDLTPYPAEPDKNFGSGTLAERGVSDGGRIVTQD